MGVGSLTQIPPPPGGGEVLPESLSLSVRVLDLRLVYVAPERSRWEGLGLKTPLPSCTWKKKSG